MGRTVLKKIIGIYADMIEAIGFDEFMEKSDWIEADLTDEEIEYLKEIADEVAEEM